MPTAETWGTAWTPTGRLRHLLSSADPAAMRTLCGVQVTGRSPLGLDRREAVQRTTCRRCLAALPRP